MLELLGVGNYNSYNGRESFYIQTAYDGGTKAVNIKGFDYFLDFNENFSSNNNDNGDTYYPPIFFGHDTLYIKYINKELHFYENQKFLKSVDFNGYVRDLRKQPKSESDPYYTQEQLTLSVDTDSLVIQLNINAISGNTDEKDSLDINTINTNVLIKRK